MGRDLNVDYVLEGSWRGEGGRVRITAKLIHVKTQTVLWTQNFEREMAVVLTVQSDVAKKVAESLALKLLPKEQARLAAAARPVVPEAYQAWLKGRELVGGVTPEDTEAAIAHFELALKKDPNFAQAYASLCTVWVTRASYGYTPPREAIPKARAAVLKAIELDDSLAAGHGELARIAFFYDWNWAAARGEWERAIELNPNPNLGGPLYAIYLNAMKRPEEAMAVMRRVLELNPVGGAHQRAVYAGILNSAGRYDEAIVQSREAIKRAPRDVSAHDSLAFSLFRKAMYDESLEELKAAYRYGGDRETEEALTQGYAQSGYSGALRRAADLLAARASRGVYVSPTEVAGLYAWAGDQVQALEWLEKGLVALDGGMPQIGASPKFETLRNTPGFQSILRRMNLPQ